MASYVKKLQEHLIVPKWMTDNIMFEGITGSVAYGVSTDYSDMDIVGFCIPPKELVFPHLAGEISGFGNQLKRFDVWQQHHIEVHKKSYDFAIYSIVKFFQLCMENNPNMIDVLFLPRNCVLHSTQIYEHMRENKKLFLHKGSWFKFRGYAYSQFSKAQNIPKNIIEVWEFENSVGIENSVNINTIITEFNKRGLKPNETLFK